jgi:DNA anti-recombination protein RmuC
MGLGNTAKKLQKVMDSAEKLYAKMNEIIGELNDLRQQVEDTGQQVDHLERDVAEQRALIDALAQKEGIDTDGVLEGADLPPEPDADKGGGGVDTGDGEATDVPVSDESSDD